MVFNMPQKKVVIPRLKLADTEIESVDQFNFLGITLDKHLRVGAGRQPNFFGHLSDIIFVYVHILGRHTPTFIVIQ